jgi:hypothetical protein
VAKRKKKLRDAEEPPKRMEGGVTRIFYFFFLFFKHNKNRFLPFSTPPPEMTWKPPRIAVGYASLPPLFMYIFSRKKTTIL